MREQWYSHLTEDGFTDIEDTTTQGEPYIPTDLRTSLQFEAKFSYYQWAREKLNQGRFDSTKDRLIWQYHAEGVSRREMSPRVGLEQSWITRKIHKIENYLKTQAEIIGSVCFEQSIA